jgi:DNA-binding GntR family transcriptional regulator
VDNGGDRQSICASEETRVPEPAVTLSGGVVASSTRREEVSTRIRRALLTGELRPGQRIKEVHLAEALGVSRPTLRESLQQLVHEGALVQVPYKGIHVAQPTAEELRDVAEVRMPLEKMAALRLSRDPHGPAMDGVREALAVHLDAIGTGDALQAHVTHIGLHKAIWDLADSPTLRKIWPLVGSQVHVALTVDQAVRHDPERDAVLHRRLVRVIEEGDEAAIAAEVEEHIRRSVDEVLRRLT